MIFDSTLLAAVASEMRARLGKESGAAILRDVWQGESQQNETQSDEIASVASDERQIFLQFRDATFLIDTHPQRASCYFLSHAPRPQNTQFSGVLRKSLRGAQLVKIVQPNFDRILRLEFLSHDESGTSARSSLVCELMDRRANAILLDDRDIVVDAVKRLPPFLNRARVVLPHQPYAPPPSSRENPLLVVNWRERVLEASQNDDLVLTRWLRDKFTGISPLLEQVINNALQSANDVSMRDVAMRNVEACEKAWEQVKNVAHGRFKTYRCNEHNCNEYGCHNQTYPLAFNTSCVEQKQSISALLEEGAASEVEVRVLEGERSALLSHVNKKLKSNAAQCEDTQRAQTHAQEAEQFLRIGNLILMRAPEVEVAIDGKQSRVVLRDEGEQLHDVAIETDWSVGDNAQRWFNRYKRAQKISADAPQRLRVLEQERTALENFKTRVENARAMNEIEKMAQEIGFQRDEKKAVSRTKQQEELARPENRVRRQEIDGWTVFLGRSAEENQLLLSKIARPSDLWMHVRDAPSAHVIIKNQKGRAVPDRVLEEAARWLAQVSRRGKSGDALEIIYTPAKWVRAVKGAPGRVTLARFQTRLVQT